MAQSQRAVNDRVTPMRKTRGVDTRRQQLDQLVDLQIKRDETIDQLVQEQRIQFQRIAQMQAELDVLKHTLDEVKSRFNAVLEKSVPVSERPHEDHRKDDDSD